MIGAFEVTAMNRLPAVMLFLAAVGCDYRIQPTAPIGTANESAAPTKDEKKERAAALKRVYDEKRQAMLELVLKPDDGELENRAERVVSACDEALTAYQKFESVAGTQANGQTALEEIKVYQNYYQSILDKKKKP
jgi:hypothetical protein